MALTASERTLRARGAAYGKHARYDSKESTQPARDGFREKFVKQVDPDLVLDEEERNRRADAALKSYMQSLALKSAKARRLAKSGAPDVEVPDTTSSRRSA